MPILDPYETSYGKLINKSRLVKEIRDYVLKSGEKLNYEYESGSDATLAFITGYSKEEQELSLFEHPLLFKDIKDKDVIAVDMRKFLRESKEKPLKLSELVKDGAGFDFNLLRGLIIADFLEHNYGNLRQCYAAISMSYAATIASLLTNYVKLNPEEMIHVEIGCAYFINTLFIDAKDIEEMKPNLVARVSSFKYSIPVTKTIVSKTLENVYTTEQDLNGLITIIKQVLPEEKAILINDTLLVNLLSNVWYGPGGNETLAIGLEHLPTWVAVVYVSLAHSSYKRSRLTGVLEKYRKSIDAKSFVKDIENYINEKDYSKL